MQGVQKSGSVLNWPSGSDPRMAKPLLCKSCPSGRQVLLTDPQRKDMPAMMQFTCA